MARKFSHENVKALEVDGSAEVYNVDADVLRRRVSGYAKRAGRSYQVDAGRAARFASDRSVERGHVVTRLPDPQP